MTPYPPMSPLIKTGLILMAYGLVFVGLVVLEDRIRRRRDGRR